MGKNYLHKSFFFIFCITLIFSLLSIVDYDSIDSPFSIKPIRFFSDILKTDSKVQNESDSIFTFEPKNDSLAQILLKDTLTISLRDSTKKAKHRKRIRPPLSKVEVFQNFSDSDFPLENFFYKLSESKQGKSKVRIAWFGDSFTDADIVVSDMRDTLQSVYGGNGVGFMPITYECPGFRRSVIHSFKGWNASSIIARKGSKDFGINGSVYFPDSLNSFNLAGSRRFKHTRKFDIFRLFYSSSIDLDVQILINDTVKKTLVLKASSIPNMVSMDMSNMHKVKINIPEKSDAAFYGASLEDKTGIYIDNFSIKGNSGLGLLAIPNENLMAFDSLLNYDLIVLQFGLNAVNSDTRSYKSYMHGMSVLIDKFQKTFPGTPIVLMAVSDRSERLQGEYVTMKSIIGLVNAQKELAKKHAVLFWNLYQAMGGENSMADYVQSKPPLANKDYTHLNFIGGKYIGLKFARSLIYEGSKYPDKSKGDSIEN